ncbi:MAG: hypothetical protein R3F35_10240 [Myxococcota bacterium]
MPARLLRPSVFALTLLLVAALVSGAANAMSVDCATAGCIGGVYTLNVERTGTNLYLATYTIDTSVPFSVGATTLVDFDFKVANDYVDAMIVSGPGAALGEGPLTGSGCGGSNGSFVCADVSPDLGVGGVYTWKVRFGATGLIDESEWHVGARYTAPGKTRGWVISETAGAPAVPEPTAAMVFGFGMLVVGGLTRRPQTRD